MVQNSSVFIFPYKRPLSVDESETLLRKVRDFLFSWNAHGKSLETKVWMEESRFLFIEEAAGAASGCSKDKLFRIIEEINSVIQLQLSPDGHFFVESEGEILEMTRKELKEKWLKMQIGPKSIMFPVWIATGADKNEYWKKPLEKFPALLPKNDLV